MASFTRSAEPDRIQQAAGALGYLVKAHGPGDARVAEARAYLAAVRREVAIEQAAATAAASDAPPLTDGEIERFATMLRGASSAPGVEDPETAQ